MSWCTLYVVITAKNKEFLLKIRNFLRPLFCQFLVKSAKIRPQIFFLCGPFWAFWPKFLPPGNTAEDLFTAGRAGTANRSCVWWCSWELRRPAGRAGTARKQGGQQAGFLAVPAQPAGPFSSHTDTHSHAVSQWQAAGTVGTLVLRSSVLWFAADSDCIPIVGAAKS